MRDNVPVGREEGRGGEVVSEWGDGGLEKGRPSAVAAGGYGRGGFNLGRMRLVEKNS